MTTKRTGDTAAGGVRHGVPAYDPGRLLDAVLERLALRNDAALSAKLNIARPILRGIRHGRLPVTGSLLLWMQEATGYDIAELRALMGDRRQRYRVSRIARHGHPAAAAPLPGKAGASTEAAHPER